MAKKEDAQLKLEATIVTSEQKILEARQKAQADATAAYAAAIQDETKLTEEQAAEKIAALEKFHKFALISNQEYMDAVNAIERRTTDEFKKELQERSADLNYLMDIIEERKRRMESIISQFTGPAFEDIKKYFGGVKEALMQTTDSMAAEIRKFLSGINSGSYEMLWSASEFGRKMTEMVGTDIYTWAQRVTEYVNYIKGLMQSLREQIMSYQDQLDQLKGNETAILDRWYQKELDSLNAKYGEELRNTKEYQEALTLLQELYSEKRKKILEDEAKAHDDFITNMSGDSKTSTSGGPASIGAPDTRLAKGAVPGTGSDGGVAVPIVAPVFDRWKTALQGMTDNFHEAISSISDDLNLAFAGPEGKIPTDFNISKETKNQFDFSIQTFDKEAGDRWLRETVFPAWERYLELRGKKP